MKTAERDTTRRLRRERGLSIKEIEKQLGVSRSSVSLWVRDIELTEEQHERLRQQNPFYNRQRSGQAVWSATCRACGHSMARRARAFPGVPDEVPVNSYSRSSARKRRNLLPYGTCRVTVCSVEVVQHIYGAIQEYGGFERPDLLG